MTRNGTTQLSIRKFNRHLIARVKLLKARRQISLGIEETLESLYNLLVERGLVVMEAELPPASAGANDMRHVANGQHANNEV